MMKKNQNNYFILYACCIPVKGSKRSLIMDLQRASYVFIPNSLFELSKIFRERTREEILLLYPTLEEQTLSEYYEYLLEHELGFFTTDPKEFPAIEEAIYSPYFLTDCIIELSDFNIIHVDKIINNLSLSGCQNLELRSYSYFPISEIFSLVEKLTKTRIRNVEIYNAFNKNIKEDILDDYLFKNQIVSRYFAHGATKEGVSRINKSLFFLKNKISSMNCCGNISPSSFVVNLDFYLESKFKNNCLNKKISISSDGSIKNCPSLKGVFGNIQESNFIDILEMPLFSANWAVEKDQVKVCKDCEFRYMCSDCRAFTSDLNDKPVKCNYNPYTINYE